jgi:GntR family transcriptional regulator
MARRRAPTRLRLPEELSYEQPKGEQLREILEGYTADLEPGARLPSERDLAARYGVARMTVRQVINRMVTDGLVYREHGRGTFVAEPRLVQTDLLRSFSEDMEARGMKPGSFVLEAGTQPATPLAAAQLDLQPGDPVVALVRIRTADDVPMSVERAYLPSELFPGLDRENLHNSSLYALIEERWGVRPKEALQRLRATVASEEEAKLLDIAEGQPCFLIERTTRGSGGRIIEYVRSVYRGDRYEVLMHLRDQT